MKSFNQFVYWLKRLGMDEVPFEQIDEFYPFYVPAGQTVTLSNWKKLKFTEEKVFQDFAELSAHVTKFEGMKPGIKTLDLGDDE